MGDPEEDEKKSIISAGMKSGTASRTRTEMNVSMENFKFDIPESCHVAMMKNTLIEKIGYKYLLVSNPFP